MLCWSQRKLVQTHLGDAQGSEAVKVLQQKGRKATTCDLLTAVRENVKKMLSSRHSTPDELSLLVAHAAQAGLSAPFLFPRLSRSAFVSFVSLPWFHPSVRSVVNFVVSARPISLELYTETVEGYPQIPVRRLGSMLQIRNGNPELYVSAPQADLLLGTVNGDQLKQLKQELDETSETVGAPE